MKAYLLTHYVDCYYILFFVPEVLLGGGYDQQEVHLSYKDFYFTGF